MINKLNNWFDRQNQLFKTFIIISIGLSVLFCLFSFIVFSFIVLMNVVFGIFVVIPIAIIVCAAIVTTIEWIVDNSF